jgi:cell division protein FtsI (penicillin-binding protein 3)
LAKPPNKWSKVSIGAMSIGQEIGVTPVQVISMISTIANDGVYTPPRIVAGVSTPSATGPQTIAFKPALSHRVVSTMTAAQMRQMMEGVVLFGTARRAILQGYTSAGKTGTAQKVDPRTGRYSRTDYVASFAGFAPVNNPAVSIIVVIDSAKGLHQGGQVSAPAFSRIAQQVLAYMHAPHDVDVKSEQMRMLRAKARDEDWGEDTQGHIGDAIKIANTDPSPPVAGKSEPATVASANNQRALPLHGQKQAEPLPPTPLQAPKNPLEGKGTVVLDVGGGPTVPSFLGKSLRSAIEMAQNSGIELDVVGSGTAREQTPPPGARMPAGGRVAVRFSR